MSRECEREWDELERVLSENLDKNHAPIYRFWTAVGIVAIVVAVVATIIEVNK